MWDNAFYNVFSPIFQEDTFGVDFFFLKIGVKFLSFNCFE